jgi:hypothetical protein
VAAATVRAAECPEGVADNDTNHRNHAIDRVPQYL